MPALLLGGLHALSFAPGPLPGALLAVAQILTFAAFASRLWRTPSIRTAAWLGAAFGLGNFLAGISWLYISLHVYGMMVAPLAAAGVFLLSLYLSIYPALAAAATRALAGPATGRNVWTATLALALAWTAGEWLRGSVFTGFPWLNVGYAHVDSPLRGWAPVLGVYGVAFMAAWTAAALGMAWNVVLSARRAALTCVATAAALCVTGWLLTLPRWVTPSGAPLPVRLVQGNISLEDKFSPGKLWEGMDLHLSLVRAAPVMPEAPALIVLPETTIPVFQHQLNARAWKEWTNAAADTGATIALGVAINEAPATPGDRERFYNSVVGVTADTLPESLGTGRPAMRYDKRHLVPFGEFIPFGFRWFVDAMVMPLGDFDRGDIRQAPFPVRDQRIAMNICYEDVFGEELLPALREGADGTPGATIFANVSNLAWFGDSFALAQHLQMSRMRVRETGRPMLRATNTGVTAAIAHDGRVVNMLPRFAPGRLDSLIQGTTGLTPYARLGNLPILLIVFGGLAALAWQRRRTLRAAPAADR